MTKFTAEEREEVMYEAWLLDDGPAKTEAKESDKANESIVADLEPNGWIVLEQRLTRQPFEDVRYVTLTVRRGDTVKIIRWNYSGWMENLGCGWGRFDPAK